MRRSKSISPFLVTIDEAISQAKRNLAWMERNYPRMVLEGKLTSWASQHKQEVQRFTIRLLQQQKDNRQPELFSKQSKSDR